MSNSTPNEEKSDLVAEISVPTKPPSLPELRDAQGRFKPGVSGCPGGKSRLDLEVRQLAQAHGPTAIERLIELTRSKNERVSVAACEALLNRGFGTPRQSVDIDATVTAHAGSTTVPDFSRMDPHEAARTYMQFMRDS